MVAMLASARRPKKQAKNMGKNQNTTEAYSLLATALTHRHQCPRLHSCK